MTSKEKYYTPEIEEFHVGFEYEVNWIKTFNSIEDVHNHGLKRKDVRIPEKKRTSHRYEMDDWNTITVDPSCFLPDESDLKFIRVKYLDREDIESLGWKPGISMEAKVRYYDKDKYRISIIGGKCQVYEYMGNNLFRGLIKNKSELKVLLKQLGV